MFWKKKEDAWTRYQELVLEIAPHGLQRLIESKLDALDSKLRSAGVYFEAQVLEELLNQLVAEFPAHLEYESFPENIQRSFSEEAQAIVFKLQKQGKALGTKSDFVLDYPVPNKDSQNSTTYVTSEIPLQLRTDRLIFGFESYPLSRNSKARFSRGGYDTSTSLMFNDLDWSFTLRWRSTQDVEKYRNFAEVFNMVARQHGTSKSFVSRTDSGGGAAVGAPSLWRSEEIVEIYRALETSSITEADAKSLLIALTPSYSDNQKLFETTYRKLKARHNFAE
jgi:hypothetical protein